MSVELVVTGTGISDEQAKQYAWLWAQGFSQPEIAEELDIPLHRVRQEMRDERVLELRSEISEHVYEDTKDFVSALARKGAEEVYRILEEDNPPQAKLQAAEMALKYLDKLRLQEKQMERLGKQFSAVQINFGNLELDSALTRHNSDLKRT